MEITLKSPSFEEGEMIPVRFTCDGEDISPELVWESIPTGCQTMAIICDDPDAPMGTWVHWVIYNIPADLGRLEERVPSLDILPSGAAQGSNSWRRIGYGGPCPPGGTHRYFFKIYALDTRLDLEPGASKSRLTEAMEGHILAQGHLMGRYSRK